MARPIRGRILTAFCLMATTCGAALAVEPDQNPEATGRLKQVAQLKQKTAKKKKGARKAEVKADPAETPDTTPAPTSTGTESLKFSKDIAPILVANCVGCHNGQQKRTKLDLTTFEKMMAGTPAGKVRGS